MSLKFFDKFPGDKDDQKKDNNKNQKYNPYNLFLILILLVLSEDNLVKQIIQTLTQ